MVSAEKLMEYYKDRVDLPVSLDEALAVLARAPDDWKGRTIVFPKVIKSNGVGISDSILVADWKNDEWKRDQRIVGPKAYFGATAVIFQVDFGAIVPSRVDIV